MSVTEYRGIGVSESHQTKDMLLPRHSDTPIHRYLKNGGQSSSEYLLLLGILTVIGFFIMRAFTPADGGTDAIKGMSQGAVEKIAKD